VDASVVDAYDCELWIVVGQLDSAVHHGLSRPPRVRLLTSSCPTTLEYALHETLPNPDVCYVHRKFRGCFSC
jgi:hypothetical protein